MAVANTFLVQPKTVSEEFWAIDSAIEFDCLNGNGSYLLVGKDGSQVKLSGSAYVLLKSIHSGNSFSELATSLNAREGHKKVTEGELRSKYESLLARLQEIETQSAQHKSPWGFWMQLTLVPAKYVARITSWTSHLFHPIMVCLTTAALVAGIFVAAYRGFHFTLQPGSLLAGAALIIIMGLAHEFGHASACARYKAPPSDIGFTFYLVYPAFYSDVSSAWRLSRRERVIVDVGGCYFQAMITLVYLLLFYRTGWEPFRFAIIFSFYSALSSINPIFKFDGYWVVADALGVANLSRQPQRIYKYLLAKLRGRPAEALPWPPLVTATLTGYSAVALWVWGFFVLKLLPMVREQVFLAGRAGASLWSHFRAGAAPAWQDVSTLFFSSILLVLVGITSWSIVKTLARYAMKGWTAVVRPRRPSQGETMPAEFGPTL